MKLIKLSAIASTNSYLKEMNSKIPLDDETIVWTHSQTRGRGQRGALWYSEPGKSLTFSLLKKYSGISIDRAVTINLAVSLGVAEALESMNIPEITVKWPNDIMSANKKIAGILIENQLQGDNISSSIVGIGINVNNAQFLNLPHASSLHLATGKQFKLEHVLESVSNTVLTFLRDIPSTTFELLASNYEARLFKKGVVSEFLHQDGSRFKGEILGVDPTGNLRVRSGDGGTRYFQLKEIELLY